MRTGGAGGRRGTLLSPKLCKFNLISPAATQPRGLPNKSRVLPNCRGRRAPGHTPGFTGGLLPPSCYPRHVLELAHGRSESSQRSAGLQPALHLAGSEAGTTTHTLTSHRNPSCAHNSLSCQEHSSSSTGYVSLDKCYFCTCTCTRLRGINEI